MALEELIDKEDAAETEQRVGDNQKKMKDSEHRENVESVWKKAMERLGQTQKRKADESESEGRKMKKRSSGSYTVNFLREKNEQAQEMQKQELELRKQQLEVESKKQDNFMQMMLNQQCSGTRVLPFLTSCMRRGFLLMRASFVVIDHAVWC